MDIGIVAFLYRVVQMLAHSLRHIILQLAHPMPASIRIYPGAPESVHRDIVLHLVDVCSFSEVELVDASERSRPTLWIEDNEPVEGCMTVCRYLGRHMRLLPVNPTTCATVDASLELLQSFVHPFVTAADADGGALKNHVALFASLLEDSFESHVSTRHLDGFEADTLADVCWTTAWKHVIANDAAPPSADDYPNLHSWMGHQSIVPRDDDACSDTTSDTDDDDTAIKKET